jgi:phosphoribosylglycinamide formyltransferase 1
VTTNRLRCVIVTSSSGSVMNEVLKNGFFKSAIVSVVSDRQCLAIEKAVQHAVNTDIIFESKVQKFCERLLEYLSLKKVDYVISASFSKLFVGDLLEVYRDRIVNLHPSLLPAFKGMNAFQNAVDSGAKYVGSTTHFINENMDEGKMIIQSVCPLDLNQDMNRIRHRIFEQQCRSLLQVTKWLADGRITVQGQKVIVKNAQFADHEFSPNLDFEDAIRLSVPFNSQVFVKPAQLEKD